MIDRTHRGRRGVARTLKTHLLSVFLPILMMLGGAPAPPPIETTGPATACAPMPPFASPHDRFGVNILRDYGESASDFDLAQTRIGWYLDYKTTGPTPPKVAYVRVFRVVDLAQGDWRSKVEQAVMASPGVIWFIGNETDRYSQDGIPAADYARIYHRTYTYIKQLDPTATVGNAAIIQATPIRLRYLDEFVAAYRDLYGTRPPVDYWNIHNFILREDLGTWGASIPPGLEAFNDEGLKHEVWDHGDFELFKSQIIAFRQWMADNDYRNVPLTVSEYGILMPEDYVAEPPPEGELPPDIQRYDYPFVREFMLASFDFFLTYTDPAIGQPQDENRLVQSWSWFSLNDREFDQLTGKGSNGNLIDADTGALTPLGQDFAAYVEPLYYDYRDLTVRHVKVTPDAVVDPDNPGSIEVKVLIQNRGTLPATNATVKLYWDQGSRGRVLVDERVVQTVTARCAQMHTVQLTWQPASLPLGYQVLVAEITPGSDQLESVIGNDSAFTSLRVGARGSFPEVHLPLVVQ